MYKKVVFVLLIVCVCILTSCSNKDDTLVSLESGQNEPSSKQTGDVNLSKNYTVDQSGIITNFLGTIDTIYKKDKNYTIYTDGFSFRYTVNDNKGNVLDIGYHDYRGSFDLYYQGNLLVLDYGSGGNSGTSKRYYEVERGLISPFYSNPIALSDTKVAFFTYREQDNKNVLIVQDIFNVEDYYIAIERDFAGGTALYYNTKATFLENGKRLEITYPFGSEEKGAPVEYKTEVLSLEK